MSFSLSVRSGRSSQNSAPPIWFGPVFAVLGAVFMVGAVFGFQNAVALADRGVTATATITDKRIDHDTENDSTSYVLLYRFEAPDGSMHGGRFTVSRDRYEATSTGAEVTVTYLPDDPGVNSVGVAEPPSPLLLVGLEAVAGLFVVVGIGLTVMAVRARRGGSPGQPARAGLADPDPGPAGVPGDRLPGDPDGLTRDFGRSRGRALFELVAPPIIAVVLLGLAWLFLTGRIQTDDLEWQFGFPLIAGILGLVMVALTVRALRRGLRTTLVSVGPDGIRTIDAGLFAWADIAEVRLETSDSTVRRTGLRQATVGSGSRRLGIVPRDPGRAPASALSAIGRNISEQARQAARRPLVDIDPAPIGISAYEVTGGLGPIIAAVRAYAPVLDRTAEALIRERAIGTATATDPNPVPATAPEPEAPVDLRTLDASLAPGAAGAARPEVIAADPTPAAATPAVEPARPSLFGPSGLVAEAPRPARVRRSFRPPSGLLSERPLGGLSDLIDAGRDAFFSVLVLIVAILVLANVARGLPAWFAILFVVVLLPFLAWAASTLLELPSRLGRAFAEDDTTLAVDSTGIWLPDLQRLPWDQVGAIRVRSLGTTSSSDDDRFVDDALERWRITVVPKDPRRLAERPRSLQARDRLRAAIGRFVPFLRSWAEPPGFSVDSDRLDAPIEDVVALIEVYHPVEVDK